MWPIQIRARAERLTLIVVLSTFAGYVSAFVLTAARFVA